MAGTAFFDLRDNGLSVYLLHRQGRRFSISRRVDAETGPDYTIPPGILQDSDATDSVLSLPAALLQYRILEFPFVEREKVRELVPLELDGLVLGGIGEIVFDVVVLGKKEDRFAVLVVYVFKSVLRKILRSLAASGLNPRFVTSIELSNVVSSGSTSDISGILTSPAGLSAESRADLAIKEMSGPVIDLRRREFAYTEDEERTERSLRLTAVLITLLLLILTANAWLTIFYTGKANRAVRDEIRKKYSELFPAEKRVTDELYQLRAHIKGLTDREKTLVGISPLRLLSEISKVMRPGASMTEISIDRNQIMFKGECPSLGDAQKVKADLEAVFSDVTITDTKPTTGNRTLFTIAAKEKKP